MIEGSLDIEDKKVKVGLKTLITLMVFVIGSTWGISAFINSFKSTDSAKFDNLQTQINTINTRMTTDSLLRDQRLKNFKSFYGKDTLKFH